MEQKETGIVFDKVSLRRGGRAVLRGLNLRLTERRIGLIGANGSGKSAFLRLINGLLTPTEGAVSVNGCDSVREGAAARRKTGFVFQNPDMQIIMPTVAEDIGFGLRNLGMAAAEIAVRAEKIMADYGLAAYKNANPQHLSGGQKQVLALCGALVTQPEILLLDEPTNQLDLRSRRRFAALLQNLPQQLILATHDLRLTENFDRVLVLDKGRLVFSGAPQESLNFYQKLAAAAS